MGEMAAARLLMQSTFGATPATLGTAEAQSYSQWFAAQRAAAPSLNYPQAAAIASNVNWAPTWFNNVVYGPDQLRQRMAFALSEIFVVSSNGEPLWGHNPALAYYYDILVNDALGNFRTLLEQVTLSPAMGEYLSVFRNDKANPATGVHADQNYAREVMQLFTVGLVELSMDGTVQTSGGQPTPTYSQNDVDNLANVFTGWASKPTSPTETADQSWQYDRDETDPMVAYESHHDNTAKTIIGGISVPAGGTAAADLKIALDTLFNHPNTAPFISKQLIQRLVTSNPSPAYVQRVAEVFNDDGTGVRGDLLAVAKAILTDPEAVNAGGNAYGKLREPLIRLTNLWRAFGAYNSNNQVNEYSIINGYVAIPQYPLYSPSVFNFFQPQYTTTGTLTTAGLVAPEFQITNESTLVVLDNILQAQAYQFVDGSGTVHSGPDYSLNNFLTSTSVMLHTATWETAAATPSNLVDQMNLVLMAGQMPTSMRSTLIAYASAIPATDLGSRVAEVAELIVNSPQYAVQR